MISCAFAIKKCFVSIWHFITAIFFSIINKCKLLYSILRNRKEMVLLFFLLPFLLILSILQNNYPNLSRFLHEDLKWLNNLAVPIAFSAVWVTKNELKSWKYKRRSETASEILGFLRLMKTDVTRLRDMAFLLPTLAEDRMECPQRKLSDCWDTYYAKVNPLIPHFPTKIAKELDTHCSSLQHLIVGMASNIQILREDKGLFTTEQVVKAQQDFCVSRDDLEASLDQLTKILGHYVDLF